MEKQGMGLGRRKHGAGLLIFCALLLFPAVFSRADEGEEAEAQAEEQPLEVHLEVRVDTSSSNPEVRKPWSIFILVNHPIPQEVSVIPPRFPPSLILQRVRTDTRLTLEEERWTRVEYLFTPGRAETVSIEPFEVRTPFASVFTDSRRVRFREEAVARRVEPVFRWQTPVPPAFPGKKAELHLELSNPDTARNIPEGFFRGRAPLNAIIEEEPPEAAGTGTFRYTNSWIPLEERAVTLEPFSFRSGAYTLTVPGITVPVSSGNPGDKNPAAPLSSGPPPGDTRVQGVSPENPATGREDAPAPDAPLPDVSSAPPFPENREQVFFLVQGEYDRAIAGAHALWNGQFRAEALASLRKNERDSLSGPYLVSLRRGVEEEMGLGFTENERWRPFRIPLAAYGIVFAAVLLAGVFLLVPRFRTEIPSRIRTLFDCISGKRGRGLSAAAAAVETGAGTSDTAEHTTGTGGETGTATPIVTFRGLNGFISVVVLICAAALVLLILEGGVGNFLAVRPGSRGGAAVLRETQGYAIPDSKGTVLDHFTEGQPVTVSGCRGEWCLAETHDGRSGWVTRESVITY